MKCQGGVMGLVHRFGPPAYLPDFREIPGQLERWHKFISDGLDQAREKQSKELQDDEHVQFYNPAKFDPEGPVVEQDIPWSAFPKELVRQYGYERALREADTLWPLTRYTRGNTGAILERTWYRPLNEYCEWHVARAPDSHKIKKVVFTSETPEYWRASFGDALELEDGSRYEFPGNRSLVLKLYRELVSPEVELEDLIAQEDIVSEHPSGGYLNKTSEGEYNPYNKWNTTHGIVHLCSPPNTLQAEIELGANATLVREDSRGHILVEPEPLICCTANGNPDRNSDTTIGSTVNALARMGAYVTLRNPLGLYIDHIDLAGWAAPDGGGVADCVSIVRGTPGMIQRLEVEVPLERGFTVSDLTIGGVNIEYGGQIAECITVKITGVAARPAAVYPKPVPCVGQCWIDPNNPTMLGRSVRYEDPEPINKKPTFWTHDMVEGSSNDRA
jgi:hypothetical protein